jgi:hypothetical protein
LLPASYPRRRSLFGKRKTSWIVQAHRCDPMFKTPYNQLTRARPVDTSSGLYRYREPMSGARVRSSQEGIVRWEAAVEGWFGCYAAGRLIDSAVEKIARLDLQGTSALRRVLRCSDDSPN